MNGDVALALPLRADGRLLVARRAPGVHLGGLWEFPGGKVDPGELPVDAARRELREETALVAAQLEPLGLFIHDYPDRRLRYHVFLARDAGGTMRIEGEREHGWKSLEELGELEMPAANAMILRALRWRIE